MPRKCSVCIHPERDNIERCLVNGGTYRNISKQFSVSPAALYRHAIDHLPEFLTKAKEAREVTTANTLLAEMQALQAKTLKILNEAEKVGDFRVSLSAISQSRRNLESLARLLAQLSEKPPEATATNWHTVRLIILQALAPFPEVRSSVAHQLLELEVKNERTI